MADIHISVYPPFTGRNVPLAEIAKATGKSVSVLGEIIVLSAYDSTFAANSLMPDITDWLKDDTTPFFEVSQEGGH